MSVTKSCAVFFEQKLWYFGSNEKILFKIHIWNTQNHLLAYIKFVIRDSTVCCFPPNPMFMIYFTGVHFRKIGKRSLFCPHFPLQNKKNKKCFLSEQEPKKNTSSTFETSWIAFTIQEKKRCHPDFTNCSKLKRCLWDSHKITETIWKLPHEYLSPAIIARVRKDLNSTALKQVTELGITRQKHLSKTRNLNWQ